MLAPIDEEVDVFYTKHIDRIIKRTIAPDVIFFCDFDNVAKLTKELVVTINETPIDYHVLCFLSNLSIGRSGKGTTNFNDRIVMIPSRTARSDSADHRMCMEVMRLHNKVDRKVDFVIVSNDHFAFEVARTLIKKGRSAYVLNDTVSITKLFGVTPGVSYLAKCAHVRLEYSYVATKLSDQNVTQNPITIPSITLSDEVINKIRSFIENTENKRVNLGKLGFLLQDETGYNSLANHYKVHTILTHPTNQCRLGYNFRLNSPDDNIIIAY
jgi:hypothetical protein